MKTKIILIIAIAFSSQATFAAADINVCNTILSSLRIAENDFEMAKFAVENKTELCREDASPSNCEAEYDKKFAAASARLLAMQENYRKAGCTEE